MKKQDYTKDDKKIYSIYYDIVDAFQDTLGSTKEENPILITLGEELQQKHILSRSQEHLLAFDKLSCTESKKRIATDKAYTYLKHSVKDVIIYESEVEEVKPDYSEKYAAEKKSSKGDCVDHGIKIRIKQRRRQLKWRKPAAIGGQCVCISDEMTTALVHQHSQFGSTVANVNISLTDSDHGEMVYDECRMVEEENNNTVKSEQGQWKRSELKSRENLPSTRKRDESDFLGR